METLYFIGIGGTAMASVAAAMRRTGLRVTGSDAGVYAPANDMLRDAGIAFHDCFDAGHVRDALEADGATLFIIGNAVSRGNPEAEEVLNRRLRFDSLASFVGTRLIAGRTSVVIAGTHGKTTVTSLLAWVLEAAGRQPGFLVGASPRGFESGCRPAPEQGVFVSEGDEYDTAFFDKRSKFVHYRPDIAVVNNVEFDHADIFSSLDDVKRSFRQLAALVPGNGLILVNGEDAGACEVTRQNVTPLESFGIGNGFDWNARVEERTVDGTTFTATRGGDAEPFGVFALPLAGDFNVRNALAVVAAAARLGLTAEEIRSGLSSFPGVRRRMELIAEANGITLIDDFAHHPTAVRETLAALRQRYPERRIVALFEPRSNTTTRNLFQRELGEVFGAADDVVIGAVNRPERYAPDEMLDIPRLLADIARRGVRARHMPVVAEMVAAVMAEALPGDVIVLLSNGAFGGAREGFRQALGRFSA